LAAAIPSSSSSVKHPDPRRSAEESGWPRRPDDVSYARRYARRTRQSRCPQDFDAIIDLAAGMFQDLGTTVFPDAWRHDLQQALASRLWSDVAAFVAVDPVGVPIAVAAGTLLRPPFLHRGGWPEGAGIGAGVSRARIAMSTSARTWFSGTSS
jgi:hypothetical protein